MDSTSVPIDTNTKIRLARILYRIVHGARRFVGLGDEQTATRSGIRWRLDLKEGIDLSIFLLGAFEGGAVRACRDILSRREGPVAFDIGANIGSYTLPLAQVVARSGGMVHAFEPTRWAYERLQGNLDENPSLAKHVRPMQAFLTSGATVGVPGAIESSWPMDTAADLHPIHAGLLHTTEGSKAMSLDEYVAAEDLQRLDLLKLDVDGYEADVLEGAFHSILRFKPVIIAEWALALDEDGRFQRQLEALMKEGYRIAPLVDSSRQAIPLDILKRRIPKKGSIMILLEPQ
jgi:FkbM family methyltransferase